MSKRNAPDFNKPNLPTQMTGRFTGERGNSAFIPNNREAREAMRSFGAESVRYVNGYPDFSPFTVVHDDQLGTVDGRVEIGHMTPNRENPEYAYGRRTDSHAADEDLGNFAQADNELAKALNGRNGTALTGKDIQEMRERNKLTWHEVEDGKTMQLVPTQIHAACPHSGGVAVEKALHRIADSEEYDFDTGEYNAMDYTYDAEHDVLIPVSHNRVSADPYIPRGDEYAFSGRVDANPQYGNGGATQYYLPYANEMKEDGRLVPVEQQVEDVTARTGSGEPRLVKEYTDENGVHTILDYRPMDPEELKELEEGIPESAEEAEKRAYGSDDLSEEDLAAEDMPGEDFYRNYDDEYKHPLTNQENSGGSYSPDGWKEPVNLEPGQRFYQVSTDGETKSCYFTDQKTVDSCRREDGSVNFEALREKLQIGNGDDKITLTAYEFQPAQERENGEKDISHQDEPVKTPEKTDEDGLTPKGDEEGRSNAANTGSADEDILSQNGDGEDQANTGKSDEDALASKGDEEGQSNAANTGNADEDILSQNGDGEDQANAGKSDEDGLTPKGDEEDQTKVANTGNADEDGLPPKGDEEDQTKAANTGNADEDTLSQNGNEEDRSNAAIAENSGDEAETLSQNNKKEEPSKAENAGKADDEDDLLAQNSSDEEQSNAADGVKSEDGTISQNGDENEKSSGQEDEDVLAQNSGDQDEQKAVAAQPDQTQGGTEQNNTDSSADQKDSGNSKDNGMGME